MENDETDITEDDTSIIARYAKRIGAILVTGLILYFLFGIPAYVLFSDM